MVVNDNLVGNRLKALRLAKGYTQEDVGKIISRPPQNIYKYEKGVITNIPLDIIQQLADLYGVSPAYICGWTDSKSDIERIADVYNSLPDNSKKQFVNFLDVLQENTKLKKGE